MLESVLTETVNTGITMGQFLLCTITSVMLGAVLAVVHTYRKQYSRMERKDPRTLPKY